MAADSITQSTLNSLNVSTTIKLMNEWESVCLAKGGWITSTGLTEAVRFFINAVDEAIQTAEKTGVPGEDKKKFVLDVISRLYDVVIQKALPTWTWPLTSTLKDVVINTIVSNAIDWIVSKYNDGSWGKLGEKF